MSKNTTPFTRLFLPTLIWIAVHGSLQAQWEVENSHTRADLRGIYNAGGGVAWASGSNGTVLRTEDAGRLWQSCTMPADTAHLDFRGIQALDQQTAIVMSSGDGELSRVYKTVDGCRTWKLLFTNPDKSGFWDDILYDAKSHKILIVGDPVGGRFVIYENEVNNDQWSRNDYALRAFPGQAAFAASNSTLINIRHGQFALVTGGSRSEILRSAGSKVDSSDWSRTPLPFPAGESSGPFSIAVREGKGQKLVIVGGNYEKPNQREGTAVYSADRGRTFLAAKTAPGGYRSAVAYDAQHGVWITVGPNGADISHDDGQNWYPLTATAEDAPGSDRNWNALSLPFVVGPHGRIGKLRPDALESKHDRLPH